MYLNVKKKKIIIIKIIKSAKCSAVYTFYYGDYTDYVFCKLTQI